MTDTAFKPDPIPGRLAIGITVMVALAVLTPYIWNVPEKNMQLVIQAQTNLFAGWLMVVAFYYKGRGDAAKDSIIASQAETAKVAGAVLAQSSAGPDSASIVLKPGEQATATATFAGTVIEPKATY